MGDITIAVDLPAEVSVLPQATVEHCEVLMMLSASAPVTSVEEMAKADAIAKNLAKAEKSLNQARLELRRRLTAPADRVQEVVQPFVAKLGAAHDALLKRIRTFQREEQARLDAEHRRQCEEAAAKERAAQEAAIAAAADAPPWEEPEVFVVVPRVDPPPPPPVVKSASMRTTTRQRLVVDDALLVPAYFAGIQLRQLDEKVITDLLKRGAAIAGVRLESYESVEGKA